MISELFNSVVKPALGWVTGHPTEASLLGGVANSALQVYQNQKNRQWSLEDDKRGYERFLENREYNSPKAQMARAVDAGINPVLAAQHINYGGSGVPSASGFESGTAPRLPNALKKLATYYQISNMKNQNDYVKQQIISQMIANKFDALRMQNYVATGGLSESTSNIAAGARALNLGWNWIKDLFGSGHAGLKSVIRGSKLVDRNQWK